MPRILIDGTNLLVRAHHATGALTFPDGRPSGAAWGALRSILHFVQRFATAEAPRFRGVSVAFDGGRSERRLELLPTYKAHRTANLSAAERDERREALDHQEGVLCHLLALAGADCHKARRVEADDVLAVLAEAFGPLHGVILISGDEDFRQLIGRVDGFALVKPDGAKVEKFGDHPEKLSGVRWLAYRALCGDASDGIAGVPGVGAKRAEAVVDWLGDGMKTPEELAYRLETSWPKDRETLPRNLKQALAAIEKSPDALAIFERNLAMMDLARSSYWPEVLEAAERPRFPGNAKLREFRSEVSRLGWDRSIGPLAVAIRAFGP